MQSDHQFNGRGLLLGSAERMTLEAAAVACLGFPGWMSISDSAYTTPWSIMALATLRNPAMLAPFT